MSLRLEAYGGRLEIFLATDAIRLQLGPTLDHRSHACVAIA